MDIKRIGTTPTAKGPEDYFTGIRPGDIVFFEPGEKHWHGAAPDNAMTHIAVAEKQDDSAMTWMEKVMDVRYAGQVA